MCRPHRFDKDGKRLPPEPTPQEKIDTLNGQETGWGYWMQVPPVSTALWDNQDWIRFIGDKWFRKTNVQRSPNAPLSG